MIRPRPGSSLGASADPLALLPPAAAAPKATRAVGLFAPWVWVWVGVGLLLRLAWIAWFPAGIYADSDWYFNQGAALAAGAGYRYQGAPSAIWPVGYPWFLSLVFRITTPSLLAGQVANALLLTLDLLLVAALAHALTASTRATAAAVALVALLPSHIVAAGILATEGLYVCAVHTQLLLLLWTLRRGDDALWPWLLNALWLGLTLYIRPEAAALVPLVMWSYWHSRGGSLRERLTLGILTRTLLIPVIIGVVLLPWALRNHAALGVWIPVSTTGCMNVWIGHAPGGNGGWYWPRDPAINPTVLREGESEATWYARACAAAWEAVRADPARALALWPSKLYWMWKDDEAMLHWNLAGAARPLRPALSQTLYTVTNGAYAVLLLLSALGGAVWAVRRRASAVSPRVTLPVSPRVVVIYLLTVAALTLIYLPFFGGARFHFALLPLFACFAAAGLAERAPYLEKRPA